MITQAHAHYERLDFSTNWNGKLGCDVFTTFRLSNVNKYRVGKRYNVYAPFDGGGLQFLKIVECIGIKQFGLDGLNDWVAYLDSGYDAETFRKIVRNMYKNKDINLETQVFDWVLLKTLKAL